MGCCLWLRAQHAAATSKGATVTGAIRRERKDKIESAVLLHQAVLLFHLRYCATSEDITEQGKIQRRWQWVCRREAASAQTQDFQWGCSSDTVCDIGSNAGKTISHLLRL